ncbi:uncharacterized protein TNCV_1916031 [Trichonephila clavipes]|uniref:Mutator-like transposase domain-containing protein n=1 Tax=Trichonephila clavipes TaxID=2585209 RepID=A0A8X6W076_TRICX|nr:uncharacterized protein TNCV_1916031 [Trichonephila clavipes]
MEPVDVFRMFECSKHLRKLQYSEYYGDGDSKAFETVKNTYAIDSATKLECIGHVQKRGVWSPRTAKTAAHLLPCDEVIDQMKNTVLLLKKCIQVQSSRSRAACVRACPKHARLGSGQERTLTSSMRSGISKHSNGSSERDDMKVSL